VRQFDADGDGAFSTKEITAIINRIQVVELKKHARASHAAAVAI
jgi:hypothetical protein